MRVPILVSRAWRPFLLPFGATVSRSYAEIEGGRLHIRFGLFDHTFPLDQVESAAPSHWPLWAGIGWRTNFRDVVGLVGSYGNVVEVRFKERQRLRLLGIPIRCGRLCLSLQDPAAFVAALREGPAPPPKARRPARRSGNGRRAKA